MAYTQHWEIIGVIYDAVRDQDKKLDLKHMELIWTF